MNPQREDTAIAATTARAATTLLLGTLALAIAIAGCGDDEAPPGGIGTGGNRDAATPMDGGSDAGANAGASGGPGRPPRQDAGRDASTSPEAGPNPDEDAGTPSCDALDCSAQDDACNVSVCDPDTIECRAQPRPDGTTCGDSTLDNCTSPDSCQAGACVPNHRAEGTPCGDQNADCRVDDACDGNGQCVDNGLRPEGTACGDQVDSDCSAPDTCSAAGVCQPNHAPLETPCADLEHALGTLCNYDDVCDGNGQCIDQGVWTAGSCPNGEAMEGGCLCGRTGPITACLPGPDTCVAGTCQPGHERFAPRNGTTDGTEGCGDSSISECDDKDSCLGGFCLQNHRPAGTACGDQATDTTCNGADTCDGFGNCEDNIAPFNTVCGDLPGDCWLQPRCNGGGACQSAQPAGLGTACGDGSEAECDHADTCDGAGDCQSNWDAPGAACGDGTSDACTAPDTCNATGLCEPNHAPLGTACGDQSVACLNDDACDGEGACSDNGVTTPCTIEGVVFVDGVGQAGVAVDLVGLGASTTTDADGHFALQAPLLEEVLLRFGGGPGYWGALEVRTFTPEDGAQQLQWYLSSDDQVAFPASFVGLSVDDAKGVVIVSFSGERTGSESAALSQDSAMPIRETPTQFEYTTNLGSPPSPSLHFYNADPGTTSIAVTSGTTNSCVLASSTVSQFPVFARTITYADVYCE